MRANLKNTLWMGSLSFIFSKWYKVSVSTNKIESIFFLFFLKWNLIRLMWSYSVRMCVGKSSSIEWNCTIQIEVLFKLRVNETSVDGHLVCGFFFLLSFINKNVRFCAALSSFFHPISLLHVNKPFKKNFFLFFFLKLSFSMGFFDLYARFSFFGRTSTK